MKTKIYMYSRWNEYDEILLKFFWKKGLISENAALHYSLRNSKLVIGLMQDN